MKEARKKLPKKAEKTGVEPGGSVGSSQAKKARRKLPKAGLKTFFYVVFLVVWVFVSLVVAQLAVGYAMIFILGREALGQPVWSGVYSALSYAGALGLTILVPPLFLRRWGVKVGWKRHQKPAASNSAKIVKNTWRARRQESALVTSHSDKIALTNREELGLAGWPTWTDVGLGPVGFLAGTLGAAVLVAVFQAFPWFNASEAQNVGFSVYVTGADRLIAFTALVILAPIAEEIIFRGWLYGKMRAKLSAPLSILIVSGLFGLVHGQWNVGVNVFALSVVLCVMREITGTIYAGILTHMIKNGVAFYLLYVLGIS